MKKPRLRTWLITRCVSTRDLAQPGMGMGDARNEFSAYVVHAEGEPMPTFTISYQVQEIAFVQPKKARGKGRGKR